MYCEPKAKLKLDLRAVVLSDLWIIGIKKAQMFILPCFLVKGCSCKLCSAAWGCAAHNASLWLRYQGSACGAGWGGGQGAGDRVYIQCTASPELMVCLKGCSVCVCNWYCWAFCSSGLWECSTFKNCQPGISAVEWTVTELSVGTFPVDAIVSLNVYLLRWL